MAVTEYASVLGGTGNVSKSAFINMMEQRGIYVIEDGEDPEDLTPGFATHLAYQGLVFWYDSADALTAHDGVSCIVTADGKRFKSDGFEGAQARFFKIEDKDLTAPPGSPTVGDSYIVAAGATGDWASHDGEVASYTLRGWRFTVPNAYDLAAVVDESLIYHRNTGGSWTSGFPFFTIGANTVLPSALKYGRFGLSVVNQTTNAPPGSPSDGDAYVIGATPTGTWTGHARKITIYESSGWVIYTPYNGATVYDIGTSTQIKYDGSAWQAQTSGYAAVSSVFTAASSASGSLGTSAYSYSASTAPTTANGNHADPVGLAHTAKKAGAVLEITYECSYDLTLNSGGPTTNQGVGTVGLQIDSNATMTDWARTGAGLGAMSIGNNEEIVSMHLSVTFFVTTVDAISHTYSFLHFGSISAATLKVVYSRRRIIIRERS